MFGRRTTDARLCTECLGTGRLAVRTVEYWKDRRTGERMSQTSVDKVRCHECNGSGVR